MMKRRTSIGIGVGAIGVMALTGTAQAHTYDLKQVIECHMPACEPRPPIVHPVKWLPGGERVITGEVSPFAAGLQVTVGAQQYIAGRHPELVIANGSWRLDVTHARPELAPGVYEVQAEARFGEQVVADTTQHELTIVAASIVTSVLAATGQPLVIGVGAGVVLLTMGVWLLCRRRKRRPPG